MFEIGPSLREARTRRGLSAADVHRAIRVRERYLTALEEERWELLPGEAYAKGFLRTYAEFLGLDGQLYVDEYDARVARHEDEPLVPESLARGGGAAPILFRTIGAVLLVGALVGGLAAWRHGGPTTHPAHRTAGAAVPPLRQGATKRPARRATPAAASASRATFALIRAVRDRSWLSVRIGGPAGPEVFRGTLLPGHELKVGLRRDVWVRMGRPFALEITIGGRHIADLPAAPANVLLTPAGAKRL